MRNTYPYPLLIPEGYGVCHFCNDAVPFEKLRTERLRYITPSRVEYVNICLMCLQERGNR